MRHGVHNGGAAHRLLTTPPLSRDLAAEQRVEPARLCRVTDEFANECNSQNTTSIHASDPARAEQSRDPGIPCVSTRSAAPHRHSAMVTGERKALPRFQASWQRRETSSRNCRRDRATGSAEPCPKGRLARVAAPSTPRLDGW